MDTLYEWDPLKAESNFRKHGVLFTAAKLALFDPGARYENDGSIGDDSRLQVICKVNEALLFVVITTHEGDMGEVVRIISARLATAREWRKYGIENGQIHT